jgi:hypothetical protein
MNNYERLCSGVAEMADFIKSCSTCFTCPVGGCGGFSAFDDCEERITAWLLEDAEGE